MRGPIAWIRRKIDTKKREQTQKKEEALKLSLAQLKELFLALEEFIVKETRLTKRERKYFWEEFRKSRIIRKEVFEAMMEETNIDEVLRRIICQEQKSVE
jgi:hypothetical protein